MAGRLDEPPPLPPVEEIEAGLQPPEPRDIGRSLANLVLRAILLGTAGAIVGGLRGSFGKRGDAGEGAPPRGGAAESTPGA